AVVAKTENCHPPTQTLLHHHLFCHILSSSSASILMMDENGSSPQRVRGHDVYNRLSTLEMENQANASAGGESVIQYCFDIQQQMESAWQVIDWDRVFMAAFVTISLVLILTASFFPFLKSELVTDQQFQHRFILNSLTISEFQASPAQVTGKCDVMLNISNIGDRSLYHENSVLSIFLDHELLWVTRTGGFFIEVGDEIMFNVSMNTTTVSVPASFVPTALLESQKLRKPLHFKLKYDGMLREGLDAWHEERSHVYVVCGWIEMQFVSETTLKGGPASCSLENF
ncbi:hypothetical protein Pfo_009454, partial [Paulownia fortunei]